MTTPTTQPTAPATKAAQLPQTGDQQELAIMALGLSSLGLAGGMFALGLAGTSKKLRKKLQN